MTDIDTTEQTISPSGDPRRATDILAALETKFDTLLKLVYSYDLNVKMVLDRTNHIYRYIQRLEATEKELIRQAEEQAGSATPVQEPRVVHVQGTERIEEPQAFVGQRRGSRLPMEPIAPVGQSPTPAAGYATTQQRASLGDGAGPNREALKAAIAAQQARIEQQKQTGQQKSPSPPQPVSPPAAPPRPVVSSSERIPTEFRDYDQQSVQPSVPAVASPIERKVPVVQRVKDQSRKDVFSARVEVFDDQGQSVHITKTTSMGKWQAQLRPGRYTVHIAKTDTTTKSKVEGRQEITVPASSTPVAMADFLLNR